MSISLDKEWYSTKETAEVLGISVMAVHNRVKKHKSSATKIKEFEYKIKKSKYFIHRDYIHRCMGKTSNKEWYPINEASKLLETSENWWRSRLKNGDLPEYAYKKDGKLLIHISYINEQKQYLDNLAKNYYTYEDVSRKIDKSMGNIYALTRRGFVRDVISSTAGTYLSKKEVDKFIEITKETTKLSTLQEELNLSNYWIYVNILDTKKLSLSQKHIHLWSVLYPAKRVKRRGTLDSFRWIQEIEPMDAVPEKMGR